MPVETLTPAVPGAKPARPQPATPRRLWIPIVLVVLFWALFFVVGQIEKPYFYGFLYSMASAAVLVLLFSVWWWLNRGIPLRQRFLGLALVVGTGLAVAPLCHESMWFALPTIGLPAVLTTWTVWLLVVKGTGLSWPWRGALAVVALTWGFFTLLRTDGLDSNLQAETHWRWEPSSEDLFLADRPTAEQAGRPGGGQAVVRQGPGDWIGFRGAERDGVIRGTNIATNWQSARPRLRWQQRVGPGWSSVVVIGDRLFTQEQLDQKEAVVCYRAATGKVIWTHEYNARFQSLPSGPGPRATPTFAAGRLYTLGATGVLSCLDAATGKCHWSRNVATEAGAEPPMWGYAGSPLVARGLVIVFAGGASGESLRAYHCDSGKPAWTVAAGTETYSSPQLTTLAGRPQCLILTDAGLFAVNPATGKVLWQHGSAVPGAPRSAQPHLVGAGELTVASLEGPGVARIRVVRAGADWRAESVWETTRMRPEYPDYVVHRGHLYGFDLASFCCLDAATGKRRWKEGRYGRGQVMLLADQGLLLVLSEKGEAILAAANPRRYEELGRFPALQGKKTWNHPVIAHGRLFVRNAEWMACYELARK
jgi:outer membrane protein assembly factor BamB